LAPYESSELFPVDRKHNQVRLQSGARVNRLAFAKEHFPANKYLDIDVEHDPEALLRDISPKSTTCNGSVTVDSGDFRFVRKRKGVEPKEPTAPPSTELKVQEWAAETKKARRKR
jgi:hypothetical protein